MSIRLNDTKARIGSPFTGSPGAGDHPRYKIARRTWKILVVCDRESDLAIVAARSLVAHPETYDVCRAESLDSALALLRGAPIDAVVLVLSGGGNSGIELCRRLHETNCDIPIVVVSVVDDERIAVEAVASGAQDFLAQQAPLAHLLPRALRLAIERARRHRAGIDSQNDSKSNAQAAARIARLTARQREVMDLLVQGKSLKQIAAQLTIGVQAATKHRARIFRECEVDSIAQLVRLTFAAGLSFE